MASYCTEQENKFSIHYFSGKCDQIRTKHFFAVLMRQIAMQIRISLTFIEKNNEPHGLTEAFLEPSRTSTMELFIKNSYGFLAVNYFRKKATLQMFSWVWLASLIIRRYSSKVLYDACNN